MKKKLVLVMCLVVMVASIFSQFSHAQQTAPQRPNSSKITPFNPNRQPPNPNRPQIDQVKLKEARDACLKDAKMEMPKKGEKPNPEKMKKFRECMHEKMAPEINKLRQQYQQQKQK